STKLELAQQVLDFTATKEFAELFVTHVGELPAFGGEYAVEDPRLQEIARLVAEDSGSGTPFFSYALNSGQPSYGSLLETGYQEMLSGTATPAEVARKIQDGLNSWNYAGTANCS